MGQRPALGISGATTVASAALLCYPAYVMRALIVLLAFPFLAAAQFIFHTSERRYSFGSDPTRIDHARLSVDVDGTTLTADRADRASWDGPASGAAGPGESGVARFEWPHLEWTVRFRVSPEGRSLWVASSLRNRAAKPIQLGRCRLAQGPLRLGAGADRAVVLVTSGWQGPSRVRRIAAGGKPHLARILAPVFNSTAGASLLFGFTSFDRASTDHEISWKGEPRVVSSCDFAGHKLAPNASIDSETLWIDAGADPHASLERWADQAQARYQPKIWPSTPAGWVGWSWVDSFNVERYEDAVLRNARAVRRRLPGLDIDYLWVSLGNLEDRRPGAWLHWNRKNFPSGPESLVRELRSLNLRLGLWAGAFWLNRQLTADVERLREAFLRHNGKPITVPSGQWGESYVLDPTHPKTQDWLREVFSSYRKWGVRYYMIDFLNAISGPLPGQHPNDGYFNRSLIDWPEAYRNGMRVIREAAGDDTYLLTSTGPTFHNVGLVDAIRAGSDYGEGRPLDGPGKGFYPGTFVINRPEYWTSHRQATDALASNYFVHRKLFLSDSGNLLTIDKPVPRPDAEISATIFGINGGPIMLGDDIDRMSEERLEMIKKLFPRLPECARPVDLFDSPEPDYPKVFALKVRRDFEEWDVVALFNYGRDVLRQSVDLRRLGPDPGARYVVWDFWNERYLGVHRRSLDLQAPPQSVRLLRISRERSHPWLLSTDMHLRQGQAEIASCVWNAERKSLSIRTVRPRGCRGNVYVRAPKGVALANPQGLWIAKDPNDDSLIIRLAMEFPEGSSERTLTFITSQPSNR